MEDRKSLEADIRGQREEIARLNELLESTKVQCNRLQEENRKLREEKAALADVIADLKMDLKARE